MVSLRPGATLFAKGECDHALPPHFAFQPRASGKVGPEHSLSPLCREATLTAGLSLLESLSYTQSCTDTWRHSCHAAAAASRTCLLRCSAHALETAIDPQGLVVIATLWSSGKHCVKTLPPLGLPSRLSFPRLRGFNEKRNGRVSKPRPPKLSTFSLSVGPSRPSASSASNFAVGCRSEVELSIVP